jgi:hypothetical protein
MKREFSRIWPWLTAMVLVHLAVCLVHGVAHGEAHVPLSPAQNVFVVLVILVGPLAGLALTWPAERFGTWLIAVTMGGSLVFGVVNHFLLAGPDHVTHVSSLWRPLFTATAVLLAATEAFGAGLAVVALRKGEMMRERAEESS